MQEQFAVRTVISKVVDGNVINTIKTILVTGRPAAVVAVEKIGPLQEQSWQRMRRFLDGGVIPKSGNICFESGDVRATQNLAMILRIDQA